jgi:hypothetical protein
MGLTAAYYGSDGQPVFSYSWSGTGQSIESPGSDTYGDSAQSSAVDFSNVNNQASSATTITNPAAGPDATQNDRQNFVAQVVANGGPTFDPNDQTYDWNSYVHDYSSLCQGQSVPLGVGTTVTASAAQGGNNWAQNVNIGLGFASIGLGIIQNGAENGYILSKASASLAKAAPNIVKTVDALGKGAFILQAGMSAYGVIQYANNPNSPDAVSPLKAGLDLEFGVIGMAGPYGFAASAVYFGVDSFYTYTPQNTGSIGVEEKGWPALYDTYIDEAAQYPGPMTPGTQNIGNGPSQINYGAWPHD